MGEATARADYDGVKVNAGGRRLGQQLASAQHIAEPAERRVFGAQRDHIRSVAGGAQGGGASDHRVIGGAFILAHRKMMKMRAEHAVEQDIARPPVGRVGAVDAFLQLHMTGQAQLGGGGGGGAHEIGLHRAGDQNRVGAGGLGRAHVELERPDLVAAKGQAAAILALDPQVRDADLGAQAVHRLERCRKMPKGRPRVRRDQVFGWIVKLHGRPVHRKL